VRLEALALDRLTCGDEPGEPGLAVVRGHRAEVVVAGGTVAPATGHLGDQGRADRPHVAEQLPVRREVAERLERCSLVLDEQLLEVGGNRLDGDAYLPKLNTYLAPRCLEAEDLSEIILADERGPDVTAMVRVPKPLNRRRVQ
jgi:hypothetical protein